MAFEQFALKSRAEAEQFERLLDDWQKKRDGIAVRYLGLPEVWDYSQAHPDGRRLFTAVLDLRLNLAVMPSSLTAIAAVLTRDIQQKRPPSSSILEDPEHFFDRLNLLEASLNFILRYRAVWDKVMGLVVLLVEPSQYEKFSGAQSRRREFRKIAKASGKLPREFIECVDALLEKFDQWYRTPEAHGTGRIRKFSLVVQPEDYNPNEMLLGAWNDLNGALHQLSELFDHAKRRDRVG